MIQLLISRSSAKVYFVTEEKFYNKIIEELEPYIDIKQVDSVDPLAWIVYSDDYNKIIDDTHLLFVEKREEEPDKHIWYKEGKKYFIIQQEEDAWKLMNSIRLIRDLLRWQLYCDGYCYFHGGLTNVNGIGIGFIGGKKSGKTSSILSFLRMKDVSYVTNDDMTIRMDGSMEALGWPRAIGIRNDTHRYIEQLKKLGENAYGDEAHPANLYMHGNADHEYTTLYFKPKEVCRVYGHELATSTQLKYIIFPGFDDVAEPSLVQLSKDEAIARLKKNIEEIPDKHNYFLMDFFNIPKLEEIESFACSMIESGLVTCYSLTQSLDCLEKASEFIRSLVE